jgi:prepilin-type N-terminal cleavage/methylation domain-containing protein
MDERRTQRGFTLIELMIAIAVIGVLTKLVVPAFTTEQGRGTAKSEVAGVFAELIQREIDYEADHGGYLQAAACPSSSTGTAQSISACSATGTAWDTLGAHMPFSTVYCSYMVKTGTASQAPAPPTGFTMQQPAIAWFYITASCKVNGKTYKFFTSSVDTTTQLQ